MNHPKTIPSVSVRYAQDGSSTRQNELGMRPMQERAYQKRGEQYLLIKSPPASGKSRTLNKDKTSRRITGTGFGPLFSADEEGSDLPVGGR